MEEEKIKKIYEILDNIPVTEKNKSIIEEIKQELLNKDYMAAYKKIEKLNKSEEDDEDEEEYIEEEEEQTGIYPKELSNIEEERTFIGLLLNDPKLIVKYYFPFEECYFEDPDSLNAYKSILFTEGGAYSSEDAKRRFNFARDNEEVYNFKMELKAKVKNKEYDVEKIFIDLRKLLIELSEKQKISILISSHNLSELENICTKICIIKDGEIIDQILLNQKDLRELEEYEFEVDNSYKVKEIENKLDIKIINNEKFSIQLKREDVPDIVERLCKNNIKIYKVEKIEKKLEDIFIEKVGGNKIV